MTVRHWFHVAGFGLLGLLGCLRSFGPDLRSRGTHAELPADSPNSMCMSCHESESDALARMQAHTDHGSHAHSHASGSPTPLVADWMIEAPQPCTHCHRIRADE
ncbi:MAG TPA: hypothetical protein VM869_01390 [Enhygromyxa sp.]|nr:hypothetical protein [Enhygromyxa sp.]